MSLQMAQFCSFLWLSNIPLRLCTTSSLSIHLFMDILVGSISSLQFSCSVVSDSLRPHGPQHTRPPCPSPTPRVYPNSCPLSWWCHSTISSSVSLLCSRPESFPASGSFTINQLFTSSGQSIRVSASVSTLPVRVDLVLDTLVWAPCSPRDTQESSPALQFESINSLSHSLLYGPTLTSIHEYWKNHNFD